MRNCEKSVVMLGPSLDWPGGMTAVIRTLRDAGLFEKFNVTYIETYSGPGFRRQLSVTGRGIITFLRSLMTGRSSLVHVHSASRGSFWRKSCYCYLAVIFRVPFIFHIHSGEFSNFYNLECNRLKKLWVRWILSRSQAVICLTTGWRVQMAHIAPNARFVVVGNPVAVGMFLPPMRPTARTVLFMGRLRKTKGALDLIRAIPLILAALPTMQFILAGDDWADEAKNLIDELALGENVVLVGWVEGQEKMAIQFASDIFVLPSYFEGLPMGILEAMAAGLAVVSTNVGGIPDLISHGIEGLLIDPGDIEQLAGAIISIASDDSFRASLRQNAHNKVKILYDIPVVLDSMEKLYSFSSNETR